MLFNERLAFVGHILHGSIFHFFFFFKLSGTPRNLPSSPTRPSPDLVVEVSRQQNVLGPGSFDGECDFLGCHDRGRWPGSMVPRARPYGVGVHDTLSRGLVSQRSEEHTSELQSQSNLVCRLLLEKKKT